jgi:hypothetical protein
MRGPGLLIVVALFVSLCGCAESFREKRQATLRQRASFDLSCPSEKIELTPLDRAAASHGGGATGVSGCGQRATYL